MSAYEELRRRGPAAFAEETGRRRYWELLAAERAALRDPATGLARADLVEHVACAACGDDRPYGGFVKDGFHYVRCACCGTVYIDPQLNEESMMQFWTSSAAAAAWTNILKHPAQLEFDEAKFSRVLDDLEARGVRGGSLLDFGCSTGTFLALAQRRGFRVAGVEPGEQARRVAAETLGLQVAPNLEDLAGLSELDAVTCWEVLEHTKRPLDQLRELRRRVASDGRLVALVGGSAASLANRVMRAASAAFDFARYWYFTPDSFGHLLGRAGWDVLAVEQILDELDVVLTYLNYGDPYETGGFDEEVLAPALVEDLRRHALNGGMGYKFLVTARPR